MKKSYVIGIVSVLFLATAIFSANSFAGTCCTGMGMGGGNGMGGSHMMLKKNQHEPNGHDMSASDETNKKKSATVDDKKAKPAPKVFDTPPKVGTKATCPVTGEKFVVNAKTGRSSHNDKHVVFCCPGCEAQFKANPAKYIQGDSK